MLGMLTRLARLCPGRRQLAAAVANVAVTSHHDDGRRRPDVEPLGQREVAVPDLRVAQPELVDALLEERLIDGLVRSGDDPDEGHLARHRGRGRDGCRRLFAAGRAPRLPKDKDGRAIQRVIDAVYVDEDSAAVVDVLRWRRHGRRRCRTGRAEHRGREQQTAAEDQKLVVHPMLPKK
jgi:hypothetical protein